jgi:hypothetical protein
MDAKRVGRYFAAADVLNNAHMREAAVYFEHGLEPNARHLAEVPLMGIAEIYAIRSAAIFKATGAMVCRVTGIDALARLAADKEFPS